MPKRHVCEEAEHGGAGEEGTPLRVDHGGEGGVLVVLGHEDAEEEDDKGGEGVDGDSVFPLGGGFLGGGCGGRRGR